MKRDYSLEYQRNAEARRVKALKSYYADHEKSKKDMLERQKRRPAANASATAKRRALKLQRTPTWLTDFDKLKIKCLYSVAAMLTRENKEPWHVDHVIPLQGELVSGLHVPSNMRVLCGKENIAKHNRFVVG
jgi:5-methylcytosine-specific restriction endonuclease McrA